MHRKGQFGGTPRGWYGSSIEEAGSLPHGQDRWTIWCPSLRRGVIQGLLVHAASDARASETHHLALLGVSDIVYF